MEKTTLQVLIEARALIERPENWCIGITGKTLDGEPTHPWEPEAVSFCAYGVIVRAVGEPKYGMKSWEIVRDMGQFVTGSFRSAVEYNNTHTHAEVLDLFDRAIAAERAKQQGSHITEQVQSIIDDALEAATKVAEPVE